ncbi:MAG: 8-amino-7-oxononanoate synthase [Nitrospinae bacterium]|nr:8-amino-7-oxononanoate synthase [Nitrospinota bacterium]
MSELFRQRLEKELQQRSEAHLLRRVVVHESCRLNLSGNDYLQLRSHPRVIEGARTAIEEFGTGSGASPLLSGFLPCHDRLLKQLLDWKKKPAGMLFNSGFMANQAILRHLPGEKDLVLADRLIHHSMAQALTQGRARFKRYDHLDLAHLEELLRKHHGDYQTVFVVTESVFSMDGDYPDLVRLTGLKSRYPFVLILDEAHAVGLFGETGGGLAEESGVLGQVDILVGTLGKALASMGAYVLVNERAVVDYLVNFAGEFIYSTFLSPALAGAADAAIDLARESGEKRRRLRFLGVRLRAGLASLGWPRDPYESAIVPVLTEDIPGLMDLKDRFLARGVLAAVARPPTVPQGTSRLRFSLHSGVTDNDLDDILGILKEWKQGRK